jgi:hypothetical protein
MADWRPISDVPYDCPLWLRVIDRTGERRLGFPCRWTVTGWVNAVTNTSVALHPTHWQPWPQGQFDRENEARIRAIQLLLGAELAELYGTFLQQRTPPEIARLLDRLADRELNQLSRDSSEADRHVSEGERIVARQRLLIADMRAKGQDTAGAEMTLRLFEQLLQAFKSPGKPSSKKSPKIEVGL